MKGDINNVWFVKSLDNLNKNITTNISVESYFSFNAEKKLNSQYLIFKIITKSVGIKSRTDQEFLKLIIGSLMKRNELFENYELSGVLKDMKTNFDYLYETDTKPVKPKRTIKTNKSSDI